MDTPPRLDRLALLPASRQPESPGIQFLQISGVISAGPSANGESMQLVLLTGLRRFALSVPRALWRQLVAATPERRAGIACQTQASAAGEFYGVRLSDSVVRAAFARYLAGEATLQVLAAEIGCTLTGLSKRFRKLDPVAHERRVRANLRTLGPCPRAGARRRLAA